MVAVFMFGFRISCFTWKNISSKFATLTYFVPPMPDSASPPQAGSGYASSPAAALAYPPNAAALPESLPSRTILPSNMITTSRRLQTPLEPYQILTRVKVKVSFPIARHSTSRAKAKAKENSPRKAPRKAPIFFFFLDNAALVVTTVAVMELC